MRSTFYITASALLALANAQTFTECNPTEKKCPNNPAIPEVFETNFKDGKDAVKGWKQTAGTLNYGAGGAEFTVAKSGDAPTIQTEGYLHFGHIEVKMKAAPGQGIISSIVLQSEDLDEVDWEFIGSVNSKVQMNYFGKGNTTTYDRMIEAPVANVQEMHTYALEWTKDALTWIIDGKEVRTLAYADANGGNNYPQTPSNVRIGIWAGGDSENEGTREWAGGKVDYSKAPFTQTVESIKIKNYSPGKEYEWTDKTGSYKSIKVIDAGNKDGAPQNSVVIQPSATGGSNGIGSEVNVPTQTGGAGSPAQSTTCSEGESKPTPGPNPPADNTPCDCVETVVITGYPPSATPEVPPSTPEVPPTTPEVPPPPPQSSGAAPPPPAASTSCTTGVAPPPVSAPPASNPPYPTGGIMTETKPSPSGLIPSAPTGAVPSGNGTTPPPDQFPGAASHNTAGYLLALVAGAMVYAI